MCVHVIECMNFPEPAVHVLSESLWLEQSENGGDSSAYDQAAQHAAGNGEISEEKKYITFGETTFVLPLSLLHNVSQDTWDCSMHLRELV